MDAAEQLREHLESLVVEPQLSGAHAAVDERVEVVALGEYGSFCVDPIVGIKVNAYDDVGL